MEPERPELPKAYKPKSVEEKWYRIWKEAGVFHAEPDPNKTPYCITIPPPNITGSLHMGHALNNSVLDTMTRWHRMRGDCTLCLPGTDHAGIATQNVVERELASQGLTRHDLGREAFIRRCWEWREQYGKRIYYQIESLGCSYDWDRVRFTMDPSYVDAIMEEFGSWYERGLIYRGTRVVNWDVKFQSAVSDIEVETQERQGKLYHFRYPFADDSGRYITIATTRPETLLGDTAVAANPEDPRYQPLFGERLRLPLTDRTIPLIADDYAKPEFGSGAVKVTPAHDLNDFECGLRHGLPQIIVIGKDGRMTEAAGAAYAGLDRFEARKRVVTDMEALDLLEKIEDYTIQTPVAERSGEVIEPLLSEQWFVDMRPLAAPAIDAVNAGLIRFFPMRYEQVYLHWMENLRDWCISRQLWWGHRIPVWWTEDNLIPGHPYPGPSPSQGEGRADAGSGASHEEQGASEGSPPYQGGVGGGFVRRYGSRRYVFARERETAVRALGTESCWQDEDVLDTWFSSALWPHATLGWPRDTPDLDYFYPTNLLSTAQEILYLWVARMIMTGLDFVKRPADITPAEDGLLEADSTVRAIIPFRDVYVHATVLDEKGERMSKSKGNGIDPMDLIDKYGADATRFSLLQQAGKNQDIRFSEQRTDIAGNFCNKLWNASRFVLMNLDAAATGALPPPERRTTADRWILSRLAETTAGVNAALANYDMDDATRLLYQFFWNDYCDWYVEMAKVRLRSESEDERTHARNMLCAVLEMTLRLLHPMIPFITEEIWQALPATCKIQGEGREESVKRLALSVKSPMQEAQAKSDSTLNAQRLTLHTICLSPYPQADTDWRDEAAHAAIGLTIEATRALRNLRAEMKIEPGARLAAAAVPNDETARLVLRENADLIANLARLSGLQVLDSPPAAEAGQWMATPIAGAEVFLEIGDALDMDKERERLDKELAEVEKQIARSEGMLGNPKFIERANPGIVAKEQGLLTEWQEKRARLQERRGS